jgi:hypothetical protein
MQFFQTTLNAIKIEDLIEPIKNYSTIIKKIFFFSSNPFDNALFGA